MPSVDELANATEIELLTAYAVQLTHGRLGDFSDMQVYQCTKATGILPVAEHRNLAQQVDAELVKRGVLKPDNRQHRGLGYTPSRYRVSVGWLRRQGYTHF